MRRGFEYGMAVSVATAALFSAGCGNGNQNERAQSERKIPAAPKLGEISCHASKPDTWLPAPDKLDAATVAARLGVRESQIEGGLMGPAACDTAIPTDGIAQGVVVAVQGIDGGPCLALGLDSGDHPPESGKAYRDILAVCAAPAGEQA